VAEPIPAAAAVGITAASRPGSVRAVRWRCAYLASAVRPGRAAVPAVWGQAPL